MIGASEIDTGELLMELEFTAEVERLKIVRHSVKTVALELGFDEDRAMEIVLAVDEAVTNIIRHAYGADKSGTILLRTFRHPEGLMIELQDFAPAVDPRRVKPRALEDIKPGKLGTHLIREIMDRTDLQPGAAGKGNLLRLFKKLE